MDLCIQDCCSFDSTSIYVFCQIYFEKHYSVQLHVALRMVMISIAVELRVKVQQPFNASVCMSDSCGRSSQALILANESNGS